MHSSANSQFSFRLLGPFQWFLAFQQVYKTRQVIKYYGLSLHCDDVLIMNFYFPHCLKPSSLVSLQGRCNSVCNSLPGGLEAKKVVFTESIVLVKGHADSHMLSQQQRSLNVRLLHRWLSLAETRNLHDWKCSVFLQVAASATGWHGTIWPSVWRQ